MSLVPAPSWSSLPGFLLTANAWVLASSPLSVFSSSPWAADGSSGLIDAVAWMGGLQVAAGIVLLIGAIARLRSAYRVNLGGDGMAWRGAESPRLAVPPQAGGE